MQTVDAQAQEIAKIGKTNLMSFLLLWDYIFILSLFQIIWL